MSTCRCRRTVGAPRGASTSEEWLAAEPAPARLHGIVQRTLDYLGLDIEQWEVRIADTEKINRKWWKDVDARAIIVHGSTLHILVNPAMGQEARKMGLLQHQILVHEVLHYMFFAHERTVQRLLGEDSRRGITVYESGHDLLDRLAWTLVYHIFPDINPEEDILAES